MKSELLDKIMYGFLNLKMYLSLTIIAIAEMKKYFLGCQKQIERKYVLNFQEIIYLS